MLRFPAIWILGALLPLLMALPSAAQTQSTWNYAGVTFPATLDTFVSQRSYRWVNQPEFGMSLTYVIPGDDDTELTFYIYPIRSNDSAAATGNGADERDQAVTEIKSYAKQYRDLTDFQVDSIGPLIIRNGTHSYKGGYAVMRMRFDTVNVTSLVVVFVRDQTYLKVRLSFLERAGPALWPHLLPLLTHALAEIEEPKR